MYKELGHNSVIKKMKNTQIFASRNLVIRKFLNVRGTHIK